MAEAQTSTKKKANTNKASASQADNMRNRVEGKEVALVGGAFFATTDNTIVLSLDESSVNKRFAKVPKGLGDWEIYEINQALGSGVLKKTEDMGEQEAKTTKSGSDVKTQDLDRESEQVQINQMVDHLKSMSPEGLRREASNLAGTQFGSRVLREFNAQIGSRKPELSEVVEPYLS